MNDEFRAINHCLQLLKSCDIPRLLKLQVELQLIQIKTLLINDTLTSSDTTFQQLLTHMRALEENAAHDDNLVNVMGEIKTLLSGLDGAAAGDGRGFSLTQPSRAPHKA